MNFLHGCFSTFVKLGITKIGRGKNACHHTNLQQHWITQIWFSLKWTLSLTFESRFHKLVKYYRIGSLIPHGDAGATRRGAEATRRRRGRRWARWIPARRGREPPGTPSSLRSGRRWLANFRPRCSSETGRGRCRSRGREDRKPESKEMIKHSTFFFTFRPIAAIL